MERAPKRAKKDWKAKCIEKFGLLRVPPEAHWRDQSTEWAWERYYHFRSLIQEQHSPQSSPNEAEDHIVDFYHFNNHDGGDNKYNWVQQLTDELGEQMGTLQKEVFGLDDGEVLWDYTPWVGKDIRFKGRRRVGTVTHHAVVWSPFAIPHAIRLEHYYHHHSRAYSVEFRVSWSYRLFDFEDENFQQSSKTELCSNTWNRVDVIRTRNLSARTVVHLKTFLFGPSYGEARENLMNLDDYELYYGMSNKHVMDLDDYSFLRLLFGSMATFDFGKEHGGDGFGYTWKPTEEVLQSMALEGALDGTYDFSMGGEDSNKITLPWLAHRIKEITNNLTRAESYYRPPTLMGGVWGYDSDGEMSHPDESASSSWRPIM